jgi:signal transduction histidine kinase
MAHPADIWHQQAWVEHTTNASRTGAGSENNRLRRYYVVWPLCTLLALEMLAFGLVGATHSLPITRYSIIIAGCIMLAGLLPAFARPSQPASLFGCFAILLACEVLLTPSGLAAQKQTWSGAMLLKPISNIAALRLANGTFLAPLAMHIAARFPRRSTYSNRTLAGCYGITTILLLTVFFAPPVTPRISGAIALSIAWLGMLGAAGWLLVRTSRDPAAAYGRAAQQARLLLLSVTLAIFPLLARPLLRMSIGFDLPYNLLLAAQIMLPLGVAYTILQHDLFGIDAALRRALAYAALSITLLAIYFGLTAILTNVLLQAVRPFRGLATVAGLMTAAAAFASLHHRVQYLIDCALYPERLIFQRETSAAHATLSQVLQRDAVVKLLENDLPERIGATWATLALGPHLDMPAYPHVARAWRTSLFVGGRWLGYYWVGPRCSGLPYAGDEQEQLQALAQQAALVLAYAETFEALIALNHELEERVTTRTAHLLAQQRALIAVEERQRLARDLHDSVKQALFSLGLGIRSVRNLVHADPNAAVCMLQAQEQLAVQAQVEMGDLLTQLRAPLHADRDLVDSLIHLCKQLEQQQGLAVTLQAPSSLELAEPLVQELLHVAKEALHNVVKHSGVSTVALALSADATHLTMTIVDRGCGFDPSTLAEASLGIRGMRERIVAVGGTLAIQSALGRGTAVQVQLKRR